MKPLELIERLQQIVRDYPETTDYEMKSNGCCGGGCMRDVDVVFKHDSIKVLELDEAK